MDVEGVEDGSVSGENICAEWPLCSPLTGRARARVDRLRYDAFKTSWQALADQRAVSHLVTIKLKARFIGQYGPKQRLCARGAAGVPCLSRPSVAACVSVSLGRPLAPTPHNSPSR
jgi:hypothetical protein